jgi:hypothetical protein
VRHHRLRRRVRGRTAAEPEHPLGEGGERLHIAPITLGAGERLFDGVDLALEPVEARNTDLVTHVRYRVLR